MWGHFSRLGELNGFDLFRPARPGLDTSQVVPGGFKRDINYKGSIDKRWHSFFPFPRSMPSAPGFIATKMNLYSTAILAKTGLHSKRTMQATSKPILFSLFPFKNFAT